MSDNKKRKINFDERKEIISQMEEDWLEKLVKSSIELRYNVISKTHLKNDPDTYIMILEETANFISEIHAIFRFPEACAWVKHGIVRNRTWLSKKFDILQKKFLVMRSQLRDENIDDHLEYLGYTKNKLPRILEKDDPYVDYRNDGELYPNIYAMYSKCRARLIYKNTNLMNTLSCIISEYAYNEYDDVDSWRFAPNVQTHREWSRNNTTQVNNDFWI